MPICDHYKFKQPEDCEIKIWRYMDFTKLVFTLEESGLFFSRLDRLGDPFEGSVPPASDEGESFAPGPKVDRGT